MKINLAGFLVSLVIHGGLFALFSYSLATEKTLTPIEKLIPLQLAMFQEPTAVPQAEKVPVVEPEPIQTVAPILTTIAQTKPTQAKPTPTQPVQAKPIRTKPTPPKTVKSKLIPITEKKPKKIAKKRRNKEKKSPIEKRKEETTKKVPQQKTSDKALDEMIRAYQKQTTAQAAQAQRKQTTPKSTYATQNQPKTSPVKKTIKPTRPVTKVVKQPTVKKESVTVTSKPSTQSNKQAEQAYQARLQRLIAQQKKYPKRAKRRQTEGTVIVSFTLYANGTIVQTRIKKSSGSSLLDKAALKTIQSVSGALLAFPSSIKRTQWQFSLPLVYRLR